MTAISFDRRLTAVMLALAVAGIAISGYLTTVHFAGKPVYCGGLSSCETVNSSEYAEMAGVPVALLGLGSYITLAALALLRGRVGWALPAMIVVGATGVLYSGYLTWVELAVLHAICLWCVTSAIVVTALTAVAIAAYLANGPAAAAPTMPAARRARA